MTEVGIEQRLKELSGWRYTNLALEKTFKFANFTDAFAFMAGVAPVADRMNHHPDWSNSYNTVAVRLSTHSAGGVTEQDFALAREMDRLSRKNHSTIV